jgi:hypothetical protein
LNLLTLLLIGPRPAAPGRILLLLLVDPPSARSLLSVLTGLLRLNALLMTLSHRTLPVGRLVLEQPCEGTSRKRRIRRGGS